MKRPVVISLSLILLGVLLAVNASLQKQRADLKLNYAQVVSGLAAAAETTSADSRPGRSPAAYGGAPSPELLHLRAEVTRLTNRKRELTRVVAENEQLKLQLANRAAAPAGGVALPRDYLKTSDAIFSGYASPESTLQSFLWAVQRRDINSLLQAFDAEAAEQLRIQIQNKAASEDFFAEAGALPGMRVVNTDRPAPDEVVLHVEVMPGLETSEIKMRRIGTEWKFTSGF